LNKQTALIHTQDDLAVPREVAQYLHDHIPNSTLQIINATGHFPHISAPQELVKALKQLI
jgi:sigma-B regulation protein RsbQ